MEFIFDALRIETLNVLANMTIEEKLNFHTSLVDRLANEQSGGDRIKEYEKQSE